MNNISRKYKHILFVNKNADVKAYNNPRTELNIKQWKN